MERTQRIFTYANDMVERLGKKSLFNALKKFQNRVLLLRSGKGVFTSENISVIITTNQECAARLAQDKENKKDENKRTIGPQADFLRGNAVTLHDPQIRRKKHHEHQVRGSIRGIAE